jgi:hypothetical protein
MAVFAQSIIGASLIYAEGDQNEVRENLEVAYCDLKSIPYSSSSRSFANTL